MKSAKNVSCKFVTDKVPYVSDIEGSLLIFNLIPGMQINCAMCYRGDWNASERKVLPKWSDR